MGSGVDGDFIDREGFPLLYASATDCVSIVRHVLQKLEISDQKQRNDSVCTKISKGWWSKLGMTWENDTFDDCDDCIETRNSVSVA